jgi:hypothetical protein
LIARCSKIQESLLIAGQFVGRFVHRAKLLKVSAVDKKMQFPPFGFADINKKLFYEILDLRVGQQLKLQSARIHPR